MTSKAPSRQSYPQLPTTLPAFSLSGAMVMPGDTLPLNIFESCYLDMRSDAMKSN